MLTAKDRKSLGNISGISGARKKIWMYFVPVILTMTSVFNLWMASLWGQRMGLSLPALVQVFFAGTDPSRSYLGILIRAEDQLEMALLSFGAAVLTLVIAIQHQKLRQFHLRIIDTLNQNGAL